MKLSYEEFALDETFALSESLCFHAITAFYQVACSCKLLVTKRKERYRFGLCARSGKVLVIADGVVKSRMMCDEFVTPWVPKVCTWAAADLLSDDNTPIMYGLELKGLINARKDLRETFLVYLLKAHKNKKGY